MVLKRWGPHADRTKLHFHPKTWWFWVSLSDSGKHCPTFQQDTSASYHIILPRLKRNKLALNMERCIEIWLCFGPHEYAKATSSQAAWSTVFPSLDSFTNARGLYTPSTQTNALPWAWFIAPKIQYGLWGKHIRSSIAQHRRWLYFMDLKKCRRQPTP